MAKKGASKSRRPAARRSAEAAAVQQARNYDKIRKDHSAEIAEDYVELIAQMIRSKGEARAVDLASRLGVSHVTVTKTISRLQRDGFVRSEPYRAIFLTEKGEQLALSSEQRHKLVVEFLMRIGVNGADAEADAEGIEHHVSQSTLDAMRCFVSRG